MKKFFKFGCFVLIGIFVIIVITAIIGRSNDNPKEKTSTESKQTTTKETAAKETAKTVSWNDKIKEVASSDKNATEKSDEISKYAHDYKPTDDQVEKFFNDIIKEYKDKNYIKDISNHEYMLTNIFKSQVVEKNAQEKVMQDFAFDFLQNSKYNYRGVEKPTSAATLANERQMDKSLNKMRK
ncbi:hypothetical protein [Bacillus sp. BP-3]|uniref:hypothetical protein n=1 Tax=Bacillus sp. BP-3 TaxID=3022773 RepID=UPI00232AACE7|nr:hypothetical protein [Bacillus sp. BP-3]MDC2864559.1 hypothetical protein [Bacillus sp. BP-3]